MTKDSQDGLQSDLPEPLIPVKKSLEDGTLPISQSSWYAGVNSGRYPAATKIGRRNFYTPSTLKKIRASFTPNGKGEES